MPHTASGLHRPNVPDAKSALPGVPNAHRFCREDISNEKLAFGAEASLPTSGGRYGCVPPGSGNGTAAGVRGAHEAGPGGTCRVPRSPRVLGRDPLRPQSPRSEEHTSELQSLRHLVCRLLLEKKKH